MKFIYWISKVILCLFFMELTIIVINVFALYSLTMSDVLSLFSPSDAIYGSIAFLENQLQISFEISYLIIMLTTFTIAALYYQFAFLIVNYIEEHSRKGNSEVDKSKITINQ